MLLLTGGHGFIGSRVTAALHRRGYSLRLLLRESSNPERVAGIPYERCLGDLRDPTSVEAAARGCEGIIHLGGLSRWADIQSPQMPEVVVGGTRNVLQAGLRTVFVSSVTALGGSAEPEVRDENSVFDLPRPGFGYAHAKREAEALCRGQVIVNPAEVYGPLDTEKVTCGTLLDFVNGPALVTRGGTSVCHVDDVAEGIVAAWEKGRPGERYILGGDNLSIRELAALTLELVGKRKPIVTVPGPLLRSLAWLGRRGLPLPFEAAVVPYALRYWWVSNAKARHELGVSFRGARETLEPTLQWLGLLS